MRQRFGSQETDGGDVGVGGRNKRVSNGEGRGGGFDVGEMGGDVGIRGFGTEKAKDLAGGGAIRGF